MNRCKSIFSKQMCLYLGIFLFSFTTLGIALSMVFSQYYINEKEEQLIQQGERISAQFARSDISVSKLTTELQILEEYMNASVFVINKTGEIYASGINQNWIGQTITNDAIHLVLSGKIATVQGKINGMFAESVLTVGYPILVRDNVIGGIFMCISMPEIEKNIYGMYQAGYICMLISMTVGILLVYISSRSISRPLMEMNEAAKVIASGNFEKRITIHSVDEVGQLAESLNNMAESLYAHEKESRAFIANISHDLRSPLTSMQGFLNAILDGTIPKEKEDYYLNIILEETQRLAKLTNNIVDLSRAQTSGVSLQKTVFDLNELIRDSLEKVQPRFHKKQIVANIIFAEKTTMVFADPEIIQRVFQNLIDNALKFTEQNGKIEVETSYPKSKNKVFVCVRDNGSGISAEDQKHIFDRFFKADTSRGKDKKGGGLGLSIVKEFIKAHDERIWVKSQKGCGSEFIFSLTLAKE